MKQSTIIVILATVLGASTIASAQSLAEVARKEAERRKQVKESSKVYTNADVKESGLLTTGSSQSAAAATVPPGTTETAEAPAGEAPAAAAESQAAPAPSEPKKDEAYWRQRISEAREGQRRLELFADSLQSRINALTTDFVNRDDPAQREIIAQQRRDSLAELDRVNSELADTRQAIRDIQEEARRAGVPPGWLR